MCTVVMRVPEPDSGDPVRLLAVRDEDPNRAWRPLGHWWPERPDVRGIMDELAGGAWLATDDERVAVLLNRAGGADVPAPTSRGGLVLGAIDGAPMQEPLTTLGFNLVDATADGVRVTSWEGGEPRVVDLAPGTHMIAHDDVDDPNTPRVAAWLDAFEEADADDWPAVLAETAQLSPTDDRAIIRDNRPHGFPTLSLLVATASIGRDGARVEMSTLERPGVL